MKRFLLAVSLMMGFMPSVFAQGAVKGHVSFDGTPPAVEKIPVMSDMPACGNAKEISKLTLGADQGVADAVVTIIGAQGTLKPKDGTLDQEHCEFHPHIQAMPLGSTLKVTSSDNVLHNSHGFYEDGSTAFNLAVPIVGMEVPFKATKPGLIRLRCDAGHTWMSAYVRVSDQPFYTVTDKDGNFKLEGVPLGKYEVEVWQEWLGKQRFPIEVKEGTQNITLPLKKS